MSRATPSLRARFFSALTRALMKRRLGTPEAAVKHARRVFGQPGYLDFFTCRGVTMEAVRAGAVRGEWITPRQLDSSAVVFYIHGGGFVACSPQTHHPITCELARRLGAKIFSLDYRLAPEHPYPAALDDAFAAYRWLLDSSVSPSRVAVAGDSAGGGLVLSLLVRIRDAGLPVPACGIMLSPWTDLALTGESVQQNDESCCLIYAADGPAWAANYLGNTAPTHPLASPLYSALPGLPPLLFHVAAGETLLDDSVRAHEKALAAGTESSLHVYAGVPHGWQMFAGLVPEADQSLAEIVDFIRAKTGATASTAGD